MADEEIERELVDALFRNATIGHDVAAAKFLLINLFPEKWSAAGRVGESAGENAGPSHPASAAPDGAPKFRMRLNG